MPTSSPTSVVRPTANANTAAFDPDRARAREAGRAMAISARRPAPAIAMPSAPPMTASSTLSVSSCRTSRPGAAPSAARIAISPSRGAAREQQVGHVDARDDQHEHDRAEHGEQRRPDAAVTSSCSDVVMKPCASEAHGTLGNSATGSRAIAASSSSRSLDCRARTHTSHHPQVMSPVRTPNDMSYCSGAHSSADGARTFSNVGGITPTTVKSSRRASADVRRLRDRRRSGAARARR